VSPPALRIGIDACRPDGAANAIEGQRAEAQLPLDRLQRKVPAGNGIEPQQAGDD
jgi:hypothetical protein